LITTCRIEDRGRRWRGTDDFFASFRKPNHNIVNVNAARFVALRTQARTNKSTITPSKGISSTDRRRT
jgi:hypothetical protein